MDIDQLVTEVQQALTKSMLCQQDALAGDMVRRRFRITQIIVRVLQKHNLPPRGDEYEAILQATREEEKQWINLR